MCALACFSNNSVGLSVAFGFYFESIPEAVPSRSSVYKREGGVQSNKVVSGTTVDSVVGSLSLPQAVFILFALFILSLAAGRQGKVDYLNFICGLTLYRSNFPLCQVGLSSFEPYSSTD